MYALLPPSSADTDVAAMEGEKGEQVSFSLPSSSEAAVPQILVADEASILAAIPTDLLATVDLRATWDTRLQRISFRPLHSFFFGSLSEDKKPEPTYPRPKYNSHIASISSLPTRNTSRIMHDLRILTGEAAQSAHIGSWHSRHSSTYGARRAGAWIKEQLSQSLNVLGGRCDFWEYSPYFAPNIVCNIPPTTTKSPF